MATRQLLPDDPITPAAPRPAEPALALIAQPRGQATGAPAAAPPGPAPAPEPAPAPAEALPLPGRLRTLDSLRDPAFRWFFLSTLGQMSAVMMQILARGFLVFDLTGSFAALGVLSLASAIPQLLFGFYGGVLADQLPKKLVVQLGQITGMGNVALMGILAAAGVLEYWHLVLSGVISGLLVGMMMPARQAMIHEVVRGERLMNAVSLNTGAMNITQILAPAAGGFLLEQVGAAGTFFVMTGCYGFAVLTMTFVPTTPPARRAGPRLLSLDGFRRGFRDVGDGFAYVRHHPQIRTVLTLSFFVALLGSAYMPMLPGFVADVFEEGPGTIGVLTSVSAGGSLVGALVLASLPDRRRGLLLVASALALGSGLLAFSLSGVVLVAAVFMVIVGVGQAGRQSIANTLLQAYSDDAYRGRVMALFMTQFSMMSLGAFAIGVIASQVGAQWAFAGMATALIAVALTTVAFFPGLRRIE